VLECFVIGVPHRAFRLCGRAKVTRGEAGKPRPKLVSARARQSDEIGLQVLVAE
jgi:hypothetical protein